VPATIEVRFRPEEKSLAGNVLYLRPAFSREAPTLPLLWFCKAEVTPPAGYELVGASGADALPNKWLPAACRL
jgi:hypothetical protein